MEPGDIICKVLHNDQEKIETFLNLINMEDKVENIYYSESMQNIFKYEQQKTSQKSEGKYNDNDKVKTCYDFIF